ncbi:hypothetical protein ACWERY_30325 [Streptomyces sp. NPDC004082]|uniref:hypothetical protein n=1 Tax=unclassified Streptomyces TaxID=2593676 RepID=UPI0033AB6365
MRMKKVLQAVAGTAVLAGVSLGVTAPAQAAPAGTVITAYFGDARAQFDNSPGDGAQSWVWGYSPYAKAYVKYQDYNGTQYKLYLNAGQAATTEPNFDVWRAAICVYDGGTGYACGNWASV